MQAEHQDHLSVAFYVKIYVLLLILTGASVASSFLLRDVVSASVVVGLILVLSTVKALLIALFYMHLRYEKIPVRVWAYSAIVIFIILFILVLPDGIVNLKR